MAIASSVVAEGDRIIFSPFCIVKAAIHDVFFSKLPTIYYKRFLLLEQFL